MSESGKAHAVPPLASHQKTSAQKFRYSQSVQRERTAVGSGNRSRVIIASIDSRAARASASSVSVMAKRKVRSSVIMKMKPAGAGLAKCSAISKA